MDFVVDSSGHFVRLHHEVEKMFSHQVKIKEAHLDTLGHVNNAVYLVLFEEARWAYLEEKKYSLFKKKHIDFAAFV